MRTVYSAWLISLLFASLATATTYYVDFDAGDDTRTGTGVDQAFKHCPGDRNAAGAARKTRLQPGDTVRFKGGVVYRGSIEVSRSGAAGQPIVYDGNADGQYGSGRAVIDGSVPLTGLRRCESVAEARGNPNYRSIYWTYVPKGANWRSINLCQGNDILPISQDPDPADPMFQERPADYVKADEDTVRTETDIRIRYLTQADEVGNRPLISMVDGSSHSAVIHGMNSGAEVEIVTPEPVTVVEFAMTPQPRYTNPKEVSFTADGVEVLRSELADNPDKAVEQRFKLTAPVTFGTLVVTFHSAHPQADGRVQDWGAVRQIAAYDAAGANKLLTKRRSMVTHAGYFTQSDPATFDSALLALYAQPAAVYYKRIRGYEPQAHRVHIDTLGHGQAPYRRGGAFAIVNSVRLIDRPGEYAILLDPEPDGRHKVFVRPLRDGDGAPADLTYGRYGVGFSMRASSHITIQGFIIRKQGWKSSTGISARGEASDLIVRDVTVTLLRGNSAGITTYQVDNVLLDNCRVLDNAGHTKGIVLRNAENIVTRGCTLRRNTSTALDYYTVTNGAVQNCLLTDNRGMHANGLTFYLGCRNILVEGNTVLRGNAGLTCQHGENMIIRNNILSGSPAIGLWSGRAYNNIVITNNYLRFERPPGGTSAAIYGGNGGASGYTIANNIVDGLSGNVLRKAEIHHNVFTQYGPVLTAAKVGDNLYIPDAASVVAPDGADGFRPAVNSPAIDAGVALSSINAYDIDGIERSGHGAVDIGPWEYTGSGPRPDSAPAPIDPGAFEFTLGGYTIGPPMIQGAAGYESVFETDETGQTYAIDALDVTGEGGGKSGKRLSGGFIMNWDNGGHWLEWTVLDAKAGFYELVIDHSSEMPSIRMFQINGRPVDGLGDVHFPATGSWRYFDPRALPRAVRLTDGANVIRVTNVAGSLNFRRLRFIPVVSPRPGPAHIVQPKSAAE